MKTFATGVFSAVFALLVIAPSASAVTITQAFCSASTNPSGESNTCLPGLGAALLITDELAGLDANDPNDFYVLLGVSTLESNGFDTSIATGKTGIDAVQFDTAFKTTQFEVDPILDASGVDGASAWDAFFGQLNGCPTGNPNDKSVCSVTSVVGGFTDTGDVDIWRFLVNLDDDLGAFSGGNVTVNMRVSFLPSHNLSPDGKILPPGTPTPFQEPPGGAPVPEPTSLVLLGTGLVALARRRQRKL